MRTLTLAGLAAALLAVHAPAASAGHYDADCDFISVTHADVTGTDTYEGFAAGVVKAAGDTPTIRCVVLVNGVEAATTPPSAATPEVAATAGRISFVARDADFVEMCPVVTTSHGEERPCYHYDPPFLPPPVVYHVLYRALGEADAVLCPALAARAPGTPPLSIGPDGDVHLNGEWVWDCPPYGS